MRELLLALCDALQAGEDAVLVRVIASSGSVPRGEGAMMAVFADRVLGTIGGGAVEHASEQEARALLGQGQSAVRHYTLGPGGAADLGMVCGGAVEVCYQRLSASSPEDVRLAEALLSLWDAGADAWLVTAIDGDAVTLGTWDAQGGLRFVDEAMEDTIAPLRQDKAVLARGTPTLYVEPFVRAGTVYIFGGGHVSKALQPLLEPLQFRCVVFEDRPDFAAGGVVGAFADIGASVTITDRDYVVIMTRGHQSDGVVLEQALRTPARYVGMIGSRKKLAATLDNLRQKGFGDADFARLYSPIGLAIGGQLPSEIAISIAAELIAHRSGKLSALRDAN